jgi:hypothetical protein
MDEKEQKVSEVWELFGEGEVTGKVMYCTVRCDPDRFNLGTSYSYST